MVTRTKPTDMQEKHHENMLMKDANRQERYGEQEFNDDANYKLEGYDENEQDVRDRRNQREAELADGDAAAHGETPKRTPSRRGFAAMDKEKQRQIASKGGKASHGGGRKPSKPR
ncbi:KGG domain-containing protein [Chitinophaga deserti]|uniref:KGG domain-containing protein n=1 Tax=Chitinophaga deserti TaxID=2164099 RepID=UPI000D6AEDE8|nr:KGG domain-containing protein [Chitinophaga deserti]